MARWAAQCGGSGLRGVLHLLLTVPLAARARKNACACATV